MATVFEKSEISLFQFVSVPSVKNSELPIFTDRLKPQFFIKCDTSDIIRVDAKLVGMETLLAQRLIKGLN